MTYRFTPNLSRPERPNDHGLRCEFRRLTVLGLARADQYQDFVAWADANGGLYAALKTVRSYSDIRL